MAMSSILTRRIRIHCQRLLEALGWTGASGVVLILAATVLLSWVQWPGAKVIERIQQRDAEAAKRAFVQTSPIKSSAQGKQVELALNSEIPLLLTLLEKAATSNGLEWPSAEYFVHPATETQVASLEVRCVFKAPYPKLRAMIFQLLRDTPSLTLREFKLSRNSSSAAEVEAKLKFAVLLQGDVSMERTNRQPANERITGPVP